MRAYGLLHTRDMAGLPTILVAAPATVFNKLRSVLADRADLISATEFEQAAQRLRAGDIDLFVLCYVFDDVRPYRILNYMHEERVTDVKTILVRALPVPLRESEREIEDAYQQLGVAEFVNLSDQERAHGHEAVERFGDRVLSLLGV